MRQIVSVLFFTAIIFVGCKKDDNSFSEGKMKPHKKTIKYDSEKEILVFIGDRSSIRKFIENEESNENFFLDNYTKGFSPLYVSQDIKDEKKVLSVLSMTESKLNNVSSTFLKTNFNSENNSVSDVDDDIDDDDDNFLQNEELGAVLNYKGQVQLNDSIYMYTPKGLFIVHKDKVNNLEEFLDKNSDLSVPIGLNKVNNYITSYVPNIEDLIPAGKMIMTPGGDSGAWDPSEFEGPALPKNTSHFSECSNIKRPWAGQIFGRKYLCNYYFDSKTKVKTVFEVQDFLLFNSVRAKNKLKAKGWTGIWRDLTSKKLYIKINTAVFNIERTDTSITIKDQYIKQSFNAIKNLFENPSIQNQENILVLSNEFILNENTNQYAQKNYYSTIDDYRINNLPKEGILYPAYKEHYSNIDLNSFKNVLGSKKKVVLYFYNIFNEDQRIEITDEMIYKQAAKIFEDYAKKGTPSKDIAIVINDLGLKNLNNLDRIEVNPVKIIIKDELLTSRNTSKLVKNFDIRKDLKLEGLVLGFRTNEYGNTKYDLKVNFSGNKVKNYLVDIESGAYYFNRWGGTKYAIEK